MYLYLDDSLDSHIPNNTPLNHYDDCHYNYGSWPSKTLHLPNLFHHLPRSSITSLVAPPLFHHCFHCSLPPKDWYLCLFLSHICQNLPLLQSGRHFPKRSFVSREYRWKEVAKREKQEKVGFSVVWINRKLGWKENILRGSHLKVFITPLLRKVWDIRKWSSFTILTIIIVIQQWQKNHRQESFENVGGEYFNSNIIIKYIISRDKNCKKIRLIME